VYLRYQFPSRGKEWERERSNYWDFAMLSKKVVGGEQEGLSVTKLEIRGKVDLKAPGRKYSE